MTNLPAAPKGFIPVMLTPFTPTGALDFDTLSRLTDFYLQAGASGLFANCLSSEMFELTPAERLRVIDHVVRRVDGAVPVVATGTFGGPIDQQAEFVRQVYDLGTQAVILITGLLATETESDAVFQDRVLALFDRTKGIPVGFYECPVPYKRVLSPVQLARLVDTGRVIYHKDTCLDLAQVTEKIHLTDGADFGLYDAYMVNAVAALKAGAAGLSCIQGNYVPELITWLCRHYNDDHLTDEVAAVQQFMVRHMDVMHDVYPTASKYFLQRRGFPIDLFTRRSVGAFTPAVQHQVDALFTAYEQLQDELELQRV